MPKRAVRQAAGACAEWPNRRPPRCETVEVLNLRLQAVRDVARKTRWGAVSGKEQPMCQSTYYVDKTTDTFADVLLALGRIP
jgi:hypothetical protein